MSQSGPLSPPSSPLWAGITLRIASLSLVTGSGIGYMRPVKNACAPRRKDPLLAFSLTTSQRSKAFSVSRSGQRAPFLQNQNECASLVPRKQEIRYCHKGWPRCGRETLNERGLTDIICLVHRPPGGGLPCISLVMNVPSIFRL